MTGTVTVPVDLVRDALAKARREYVRAVADPGPDTECWAEFEALADALDEQEGRTR